MKKLHNIIIWAHCLIVTANLGKCPKKNKSRESILPGFFKNCELKMCIQTHKSKNIQDVSGGVGNILGGGSMDYSQ